MTFFLKLGQRLRLAALNGLCCVAVLALADNLRAQPAGQDTAANLNQQARVLAQKLGRERSVEGLEKIIATRNIDLVSAYESGFREGSMRARDENGGKAIALPPEIEALMIEHYNAPDIGGALRDLCAVNGTRYQTRALFDLMYAEWRSGEIRRSQYPLQDSIFQTDLAGIGAPLLELLQTLKSADSDDGKRIIHFLAGRKYRPAVPVLISLQKDAKPNTGLARTLGAALLEIGTTDATAAVLQRLAWLRDQPSGPDIGKETDFLGAQIAQMPNEVPLDYEAYKKALPEQAKANLIGVIANRKEKKGVPDLLPFLADDKLHPRVLEILVAFDSVDIWKQVRDEIERLKQQGKISGGLYLYSTTLLDAKIANPEKHFAEKKRIERWKEFEAKRKVLYATQNAL
jgi:hypothetical protein